jgi:hypothetical protein
MLENTEGEIKKVNPEKLATEDTQDEEKQKHKQQLEVKTKPTYILCRNRKGHHNTNSEHKDTK